MALSPTCVTGETWPLGKDEAHLGGQGPGDKGGTTVRVLEPHLAVTSSAPSAPSPLPGEVEGPSAGVGGLAGAHVHAPSRAQGLAGGTSVAIAGQRATHGTPGSLPAGRTGPPPLFLPLSSVGLVSVRSVFPTP